MKLLCTEWRNKMCKHYMHLYQFLQIMLNSIMQQRMYNEKGKPAEKSTLSLIYVCSYVSAPCCCPPALLKVGNTRTFYAFHHQVCSTALHPCLKTNTNYITIKQGQIPVSQPRGLYTLPVIALSSLSYTTLNCSDIKHWITHSDIRSDIRWIT